MSDYQKNIEVMAHSLALMLAPLVVLSEDDSLDVYSLSENVQTLIANNMLAEYRNEIEIDPLMVRTIGMLASYKKALLNEFYFSISDSCEQWIRTIQKEDK